MKRLLVSLFCLMSFITNAQDKTKAYIDLYKNIAIAEMQRTGVPAAITLAQGIEESGCGEGELCKMSNNHFGIKCKTEWTGGKVYHDDDERSECFRSYSSAQESFRDHSDFLKTREPYAFLFDLDPTDYKAWARGLKKAGYATEKDYPQRLIKVIEDYNLNQYSLLALNGPKIINDSDALTYQKPVEIPTEKAVKQDTSVENTIVKDTVLGDLIIPVSTHKNLVATVVTEEKKEDSVVIINPNVIAVSVKDTVKSSYPTGVFVINHTKVVYVQEGKSLLSIASQYNIALSKLLDFNDMADEDVTKTSQLIFLEKKPIKGSSDTHIVKENESLVDISQKEGVRLDKILEYNKLKKESFVKAGDRILLRPIATYGLSK